MDPAKGTLTRVGTTNTWVYTPTDQARHDATAVSSTAQQRSDEITITVSDDQGNSKNPGDRFPRARHFDRIYATSTTVLQGSNSYYVSSPDGTRLYVLDTTGNSVKVIDTQTNTVVNTITTGNTPQALAVSPNGDRLYVSNLGDGTVTVIDTTTNTVVGNPIDVGGAAPAIAVSPDGNTLYASGFDDQTGSGRITVVDLTGNQANQTINTEPLPSPG